MNTKPQRFMRFDDWRGSEKKKNKRKPTNVYPVDLFCNSKILDSQESFLRRWNKLFVITCLVAVAVDPLFFYIPVIDTKGTCLGLDRPLKITASVLRTFFDLFYILHIIFQFRTGFIAPSSRVFGRGELVDDPLAVAKRYLSSYFFIDILSIIPLPQMVVLAIFPTNRSSPLEEKDLLKYMVLIQLVPRFLRVYPLFREVTRSSSILTKTAWTGAAYNLSLYVQASHVIGALWYLFSVESQLRCWNQVLKNANLSSDMFLSCGYQNSTVISILNCSCPFTNPDDIDDPKVFNFGIYIDALKSRVVESTTYFPRKFLYCFWWALRNVSSFGQNLKTSTHIGEILFTLLIAISGFVLLTLLVENMQKYLQSIQSTANRAEELRSKGQDAEQWMSLHMLPEHLRDRYRRYVTYKWQKHRGLDEETLIHNIPKDLRRDIQRHLCLHLLLRIPLFYEMDKKWLNVLCDRLKPVIYTSGSQIVLEGDAVDEILFIARGELTVTTVDEENHDFCSTFLRAGEFCGEELITWAMDPKSSKVNHPFSDRTIETRSEVEAYALMADDLKHAFSLSRLHGKHLRHTFRFYSSRWRKWAACYIQVAWRSHCRMKIEKALREAEETTQNEALANQQGSPPSLGATIYASRFATNVLRNSRRNSISVEENDTITVHLISPPPKPAEPDFIT